MWKLKSTFDTMKKLIALCTAVSFMSGIASVILYKQFHNGLYLSLAITAFTTLYHFVMRIITACIVVFVRKNKTAADSAPFVISKSESDFYNKIRLKHWKKYAPTYNKSLFELKNNSYETIMHNMIDAEIGHALIVIFSFLPILLSKPLDGFVPFAVTSVIAAAFDMQFVFIQRYNRARLSKLQKKYI